jgi:hypothetical protein
MFLDDLFLFGNMPKQRIVDWYSLGNLPELPCEETSTISNGSELCPSFVFPVRVFLGKVNYKAGQTEWR